jgi:hypothetical protein
VRLYQIIATGSWFGTQADAKTAARQAGCSYEQVEVPTDKPGLLCFLNVRVGTPATDTPPNDDPPEDRRKAEAAGLVPLRPVNQSQESLTASEIEDFILNRASVAQVENIFSCLGTRLAELARQRRAA